MRRSVPAVLLLPAGVVQAAARAMGENGETTAARKMASGGKSSALRILDEDGTVFGEVAPCG